MFLSNLCTICKVKHFHVPSPGPISLWSSNLLGLVWCFHGEGSESSQLQCPQSRNHTFHRLSPMPFLLLHIKTSNYHTFYYFMVLYTLFNATSMFSSFNNAFYFNNPRFPTENSGCQCWCYPYQHRLF